MDPLSPHSGERPPLDWEAALPWEAGSTTEGTSPSPDQADGLPEWMAELPVDLDPTLMPDLAALLPPVEEAPPTLTAEAVAEPPASTTPVIPPVLAATPAEMPPVPELDLPELERPDSPWADEPVESPELDFAPDFPASVPEHFAGLDTHLDLVPPVIPSRLLQPEVAEILPPEVPNEAVAAVPLALPPARVQPVETVDLDEPQEDVLSELLAETDTTSVASTIGPLVEQASRKDVRLGEQHIVFSLGDVEYATAIRNVVEITPPPQVTPLPGVSDWLIGLTNLRGDILSLLDLGLFLGLERSGRGRSARMIVGQVRGEGVATGFLVDRVSGIRRLSPDQYCEPTVPLEEGTLPFVQGVCDNGGKLLVILDLEKMLLSSEMLAFETV